MIPTPADRALAQTLVHVMQYDDCPVEFTTGPTRMGEPPDDATPEQLWEFAYLLIAVTRRAGWTPPGHETLPTGP